MRRSFFLLLLFFFSFFLPFRLSTLANSNVRCQQVIQLHISKSKTENTNVISSLCTSDKPTDMEENLLNELENFTSVKYLDDLTNNNRCHEDDEQVRMEDFH